jgi:hypothetical protein
VNFEELGRKFELNPGGIRSAVARAAAETACRPVVVEKGPGQTGVATAAQKSPNEPENAGGESVTVIAPIRQKDFVMAGQAEVEKLRGGSYDLVAKLFI